MDYENCETNNSEIINEPVAAPDTGKILGLISMILGIAALGTHLLGIGSGLSLPAAVASLICGFVSKYYCANGTVNSQAKIGITCSFIQICLAVLAMFAAIAFLVLYFIFIFGVAGMAAGAGM